MFCGKCGNKNEPGTKFCGSCGAPVGGEATVDAPVGTGYVAPLYSGAKRLDVGPFAFDVSDENNSTLTAFGLSCKASLLFVVSSALLVTFFFIPFFSFSLRFSFFGMSFSESESINGWSTAFGQGGAGGSFFAIFLLLIPLVLIAVFQFKKQLEVYIKIITGNLFIISSGGIALCLLFMFIVRLGLGSVSMGMLRASAGFWLSLIIHLIMGTVSAGFLVAQLKK